MLVSFLLHALTALAFAGSASVPGEVIVRLKETSTAEALLPKSLATQVSSFRFFETDSRFVKVKLSSDAATAGYLKALRADPRVEYAEPNYIIKALGDGDGESEVIPNDPSFGLQWGLHNTGQAIGGVPGKAGADIGAAKAWAITTGSKNMVVAVIDTGVDGTHPDLRNNLFTNPAEIPGNGIDDDGNGFIDDVHGWNFAEGNNNASDDNGHGTHVAGVIGAHGNNSLGISGVNWQVSILPVKFLDGQGAGTLENALKAVQYATAMNAKVMNNSWGGGSFSQAMFDTIRAANDRGVLFVAAAGGDGSDMDGSPSFPAGYQVDNVVAVAASTNRDTMATHTSYGRRTVHIAAPGHGIYSTIPGGKYDTFSGSSFSAAFFSGASALLWSAHPELTMLETKDRLLRSRDFIHGFSRKVITGGRLNVYNAIMGIYPESPEPSEDQWRDLEMAAPVESAHPYAGNTHQDWTIEGPSNAKYMRVVFSRVDLEPGYDLLKVTDGAGEEIDVISGRAENAVSYYVPGNKIVLKLSSDATQNLWGFAVGKVQAAL